MSAQITVQNSEAVEYQLDVASMGARTYAFTIDWHFRLLLAAAWFIATGFILTWDTVGDLFKDLFERDTRALTALYVLLIPTLVIYFLYHPILEILMKGRTPGKRMAGVRILTQGGQVPGAGALLIRNLFRLLDSLPGLYLVGLATVGFTKNSVRIGDLAAGLVLVYDPDIAKKQSAAATRLALSSDMPPEHQDLLLDLLDRWRTLDTASRIRLGEGVLKKIAPENLSLGQRLEGASDKQHSKELLTRLQQLTQLP